MKRLLVFPVLLLTLLVGNPAFSQDYTEAVKRYRFAAEQGNAVAQFHLGTMYNNGTGITQDNIYAHMWYNIAATNGMDEVGAKLRDIVSKRMTPTQLETAHRLANECVKKNYKGC